MSKHQLDSGTYDSLHAYLVSQQKLRDEALITIFLPSDDETKSLIYVICDTVSAGSQIIINLYSKLNNFPIRLNNYTLSKDDQLGSFHDSNPQLLESRTPLPEYLSEPTAVLTALLLKIAESDTNDR